MPIRRDKELPPQHNASYGADYTYIHLNNDFQLFIRHFPADGGVQILLIPHLSWQMLVGHAFLDFEFGVRRMFGSEVDVLTLWFRTKRGGTAPCFLHFPRGLYRLTKKEAEGFKRVQFWVGGMEILRFEKGENGLVGGAPERGSIFTEMDL